MQKKQKDEVDELKNFPIEMGIPDAERFEDYTAIPRNPKDGDVIWRIWHAFVHRLFPILSLIYIATVLGISLNRGTHFLYGNSEAHVMGLLIVCWVAIAPLTWICMRSMIGAFRTYARHWYIAIAFSQGLIGILFYIMFPDGLGGWLWGLQSFFVASIPIHLVIYIFFMMHAFPPAAAWPLTIAGLSYMLYGMVFV